MTDTENVLEKIVKKRGAHSVPFDRLMPRRIRNILLVSSLYDSFTFEEDGKLSEALFSDYLELNLRYAPSVDRVSTAHRALKRLRSERYDLVISMLRVGDMNIQDFGRRVREIDSSLPVVALAFSAREVALLENVGELPGIDRVFMWNGDVRLFLAIIKYVEDKLNAWHDAREAGVQCLILVEDSVLFYSSYLPLLYTEIMQQTRSLLGDSLNRMQRLLRMHARPKVLLATTYEEAISLYNQYQNHLLGTIVDVGFPRDGKHDPTAGHDFSRLVLRELPDCAVAIQSSDPANEQFAEGVGAAFINKRSPALLHELRAFMQNQLGFGDFVFRRPDGSVVTTANDLRSLIEALEMVPEESLLHHGRRKDFSTWLMARSEFDLAKAIRTDRMVEFSTPSEFREHLISSLNRYRTRSRAGIVSDFSSETFEGGTGFVRIGQGSLGGKGRGLAFFHNLLSQYDIENHVDGIRIFLPPTAVLATGVFDQLMDSGNLTSLALGDATDEEINEAFLAVRLPEDVRDTLRTFLGRVHYPLAVRSSSLLEDASYQPFAGIYRTYMIPNNQENLEDRLNDLTNAVKMVYASTFYRTARDYLASTPNRLEEEKMAVVIQEVVGKRHGSYLYPDVAGVARSHNFYPLGKMRSKDGVVCAVLGLGRTVVEGGRCLRFSPRIPHEVFEVLRPRDFMNSAQRELVALDLSRSLEDAGREPAPNLVTIGLDQAEKHGTLDLTGSVYSPRDRRLHHETGTPGVRLVTMFRALEEKHVPIGEAISFLLEVGRSSFSWPVEIEFAMNFAQNESEPHQLGFLQIRPMAIASSNEVVEEIPREHAICISNQSLGHGQTEAVRDIVYVRRDNFNRALTREIADEMGEINARLKEENHRYALIGPGRWGSTDWRLGIPVSWGQISNVICLIETEMKDIKVSPSQGSHFFHNITSFGIGCLTIGGEERGGFIDYDYLDGREANFETEHVRHLRFERDVQIVVDGRSGYGVLIRPEHAVERSPILSIAPRP
ncbi:MAG: PEP/pyruvate-binding domain-containing protein [Polyangia bacterium]